jgi:phenylalanyl-tRNA synthetase beta chain
MREMVPGLAVKPDELERLITMKTAECEGAELWGAHFENVTAARVVSVEAVPGSKNQRVTIEAADGARHTVICGAPNVHAGMIAAWVPPGTCIQGKRIERATIGGVESEGMLASAAELGINRDHSGLVGLDAKPGDTLTGLEPDWIIEVDNKSLTHRPDLWGHHGMAREVAAITGNTLKEPAQMDLLPQGPPAIQASIEDYAACPRYSALVLENVEVRPSPLWLQARLEAIGLNPINNIVDATNYVLAELPQPMHAFDADKLAGGTIFVRQAQAGETLKALNDESYTLAHSDLVIADAHGPIALAGVIGGADTAISETTTRIVLESANFNAATVRLTSVRHKLRTDASMRFEKSLDPENTTRGIARAIALLNIVSPGIRIVGGVADSYGPHVAPPPISISTGLIKRKLGKDIEDERITGILKSLGFGVETRAPGELVVTVPSWRATKDISLKEDLVEEVGRMVGYDQIAPAAPLLPAVVPPANPIRRYLRKVRSQLAAQGFAEVYNYSFVNEQKFKRFGLEADRHLAVENPIASELTHMRRSLLPGIFDNIVSNTRNYREFRFFEIGREILPQGNSLPRELQRLVAVMFAAHADEEQFFELKRVLECVLPGAKLVAAEPRAYEHPLRTSVINWRGTEVGRLFELHPSLLQEEGIEGRATLLEVDIEAAQSLDNAPITYKPLRRYPTSGFDLSVVTSLRLPVAVIEDTLRQLGGDALVSIEFVRQYVGAPLQEGQKSVSYHLEIGARDHTLTNEEVSGIRARLIEGMQAEGYELRV